MKRKLIKQGGGGGLTLYVPKKWVDKNGLKGGNEIDITIISNNLLISTETQSKEKETEINISTETKSLIRLKLNGLYRLDYNKIKVNTKTEEQIQTIKNIINNYFMGFEITEEKNNYCVIENIAEPSEEKTDILVRRMFLLIKESINLIYNDLKENNLNNINKIKEINKKMNQYNNFCRRSISKKRFSDEEIYFHWGLYARLLVIQHSTLHLYEKLDNKKYKLSKNINILLNSILKEYDNIYNGFYKKDLRQIKEANTELKKLLNNILKQIQKSEGIETVILYYLGELSRTIYLATTPMMTILIS